MSAEDAKRVFNENLQQYGLRAAFTHVGAYNRYPTFAQRPRMHIRDPATNEKFEQDRLMGVVWNTKEIWEPFLSYLERNGGDSYIASESHPLDAFAKDAILKSVAATEAKLGPPARPLMVRYDTETKPFAVIMQAAGHLAGAAVYEPEIMWAVSPVYGTWIGYRAVVVFDVGTDEEHHAPPLLSDEQRGVVKALQHEAALTVQAGGKFDQLNYLQQRECYPVSLEYKYSDEMIRFFHGASPEGRKVVLSQALARRRASARAVADDNAADAAESSVDGGGGVAAECTD